MSNDYNSVLQSKSSPTDKSFSRPYESAESAKNPRPDQFTREVSIEQQSLEKLRDEQTRLKVYTEGYIACSQAFANCRSALNILSKMPDVQILAPQDWGSIREHLRLTIYEVSQVKTRLEEVMRFQDAPTSAFDGSECQELSDELNNIRELIRGRIRERRPEEDRGLVEVTNDSINRAMDLQLDIALALRDWAKDAFEILRSLTDRIFSTIEYSDRQQSRASQHSSLEFKLESAGRVEIESSQRGKIPLEVAQGQRVDNPYGVTRGGENA
jgi:hypothetical protein